MRSGTNKKQQTLEIPASPEVQAEPQEQAESFCVQPNQQVTILCDNDLLFSGSGLTAVKIEKP